MKITTDGNVRIEFRLKHETKRRVFTGRGEFYLAPNTDIDFVAIANKTNMPFNISLSDSTDSFTIASNGAFIIDCDVSFMTQRENTWT